MANNIKLATLEFNLSKDITHPNIIEAKVLFCNERVLDHQDGSFKYVTYIVLEFAANGTLFE